MPRHAPDSLRQRFCAQWRITMIGPSFLLFRIPPARPSVQLRKLTITLMWVQLFLKMQFLIFYSYLSGTCHLFVRIAFPTSHCGQENLLPWPGQQCIHLSRCGSGRHLHWHPPHTRRHVLNCRSGAGQLCRAKRHWAGFAVPAVVEHPWRLDEHCHRCDQVCLRQGSVICATFPQFKLSISVLNTLFRLGIHIPRTTR